LIFCWQQLIRYLIKEEAGYFNQRDFALFGSGIFFASIKVNHTKNNHTAVLTQTERSKKSVI
jgi:hypothetical protein